jgi:hypothetical protein
MTSRYDPLVILTNHTLPNLSATNTEFARTPCTRHIGCPVSSEASCGV